MFDTSHQQPKNIHPALDLQFRLDVVKNSHRQYTKTTMLPKFKYYFQNITTRVKYSLTTYQAVYETCRHIVLTDVFLL